MRRSDKSMHQDGTSCAIQEYRNRQIVCWLLWSIFFAISIQIIFVSQSSTCRLIFAVFGFIDVFYALKVFPLVQFVDKFCHAVRVFFFPVTIPALLYDSAICYSISSFPNAMWIGTMIPWYQFTCPPSHIIFHIEPPQIRERTSFYRLYTMPCQRCSIIVGVHCVKSCIFWSLFV